MARRVQKSKKSAQVGVEERNGGTSKVWNRGLRSHVGVEERGEGPGWCGKEN